MTKSENSSNIMNDEYMEIVTKIKHEFPDIVLPSMGMTNNEEVIDINGKDYIISIEVKEN